MKNSQTYKQKTFWSMLAVWQYKTISQAKAVIFFFLLRKEATKSPQSVILLAFNETYSWPSILRSVSLTLCDFKMTNLTNYKDGQLGTIEMPTFFSTALNSSVSCYSQPCKKASPQSTCARRAAAAHSVPYVIVSFGPSIHSRRVRFDQNCTQH